MPSLIPGYEYDIFVSYRQKDNKHDGWVTEFVENLKAELEATFKDEVSVYFDVNPHDGLLETHDVHESLKEKIKCFIFIPILSRTYCDPRCFSWVHEFSAFVDQASKDQFGPKVKLPNGNVTNRVMPIRIHDLETEDIAMCENMIGSRLRTIDFVYKELGVNRPLTLKDNEDRNQYKTNYRNQINKVANALKDCFEAVKKREHSNELKSIDVAPNTWQPEKIEKQLQPVDLHIKSKRKLVYLSASLIILFFLILSGILLNHKIRVNWAKGKALNELNALVLQSNYKDAFRIALKAEKFIKDAKEREMFSRYISKISFYTDPPGANVYLREYRDIKSKWKKIGRTPVDSLKLPFNTYYVARIEKKGYNDVFATLHTSQAVLSRKLLKKDSVPKDMVYVEGLYSSLENYSFPEHNYYLDKYEVTNKQYKQFVDAGGYRDKKYWKQQFLKNNKKIPWEAAMEEFVDMTGRPGPSTWQAGDFADGEDNFPVSGISWYEAAAYAEFLGKELPTLDHWTNAAWSNIYNLYDFNSFIIPLSNFKGKRPEAVGINYGINCFGAYDMAGNVREWCWNETSNGRAICGGAFNNISYMYTQWSQLSPFDRTQGNGFRCALYPDKNIPQIVYRKLKLYYNRNFYEEKPVSDEVFRIYKNQFLYDDTNLDSKIDFIDSTNTDWVMEKISFDAAYSGDRIVAYLFIPKNSLPNYQTMIFFPGSNAASEQDLLKNPYTYDIIGFMVKSGRAVMFPVYKGTYERQADLDPIMTEPNPTHEYTQWVITWIKDFKRSVDYLLTRNDIDTNKLGYYGASWGGMMGGIIPAVEKRLKLSVLYVGGFDLITGSSLPEVDAINYVTRVNIPVLMLNGKYDSLFPLDTTVLPFLDLLGTSEANKKLIVYDTDHNVPPLEMIKETLNWLDKYFGPVNFK